MDTRLLMDSSDQLSFDTLQYISKQPSAPFSIALTAEKLDVSSYKLSSSLEKLNNDLQNIVEDNEIYIQALNSDMWQAFNLTSLILDKIKLAYIKRSSLFPIFEYLIFNSNIISPNQYLDKQKAFLSRAVFYRKLKTTTTLVEEHFNDDGSSMGEFQDRLTLFQTYYDIYNGLELPFPELNDVVDHIIKFLMSYFNKQLRPSQIFKLSIFLRIWIMRQKNSKSISELTVNINKDAHNMDTFFTKIKDLLLGYIKTNEYEINYLYGFLIAKQYIEVDPKNIQEVTANFPLADQLSNDLIKNIKSFEIVDKLDSIQEEKLYRDLLDVNLQLTSYYIEPTTFVRESSINFFKQTYPSFDVLIMRFLGQFKKVYDLELGESTQVNIYYGYMFALINNIPAEDLKERVYISVDFSQGNLYTQYVINSLKAFSHSNIVIESNISKNTDISVSDIFSLESTIPQLIWEDPPTPNDWTDLAKIIEEIRLKKAAEIFS